MNPTIKDILLRNIEDNIAPVVYFHNQSPEDMAKEVGEYVITTRPGSGGESGGGIHEQYVTLLRNICTCLKEQDTSLPASWISGFYGSGKSSFAKLLGLALDGLTLPDGQSLAEALLARDDTPNAQEFVQVWQELQAQVDPMSVVFDIGAIARSNELIHKTVYREIKRRLGYSSNDQVAYSERTLEEEGKYEAFLQLCEQEYGDWQALKDKKIAPQRFSTLYSKLYPETYPDPLAWFDYHDDSHDNDANSVKEAVDAIIEMLERRAPGKTLFVIIDEMYQHIGLDMSRLLDMQSLVSELGSRLKGKVWLLVTGQERLQDAKESTIIGKMRDRFPPHLRVHLDRANVQEIVYQRLLKKDPKGVAPLKEMIESPGALSQLKLCGYQCGEITADALLDHYPLLPGHISLLLDISQGIYNHSSRKQGDSASVRGVLQIVWELFNHPQIKFKDAPLGEILTLDRVYDILRSALNSDTLLTMDKVAARSQGNPFKEKVAKAIALLEMIQDAQPTTDSLIAQVLYPHLGAEGIESKVKAALEELEAERAIVAQEHLGWRIQDHAGQDWARMRDEQSVGNEDIEDTLFAQLKTVMEGVEKFRFYNTPLPWNLWKGGDEKISSRMDSPGVDLDFRYVRTQQERNDSDFWVSLSKESHYKNRFIWVCGDHNELHQTVRNMLRSQKMIDKHGRMRLDRIKERLLAEEKSNKEKHELQIPKAIRSCWSNGQIYFQGTRVEMRDLGKFDKALKDVLQDHLDAVYPHFQEGNQQISRDNLQELLQSEINAPNRVFLAQDNGLGLLRMDAGRVVSDPSGPVPQKMRQYLKDQHSVTATRLVAHFSEPPYGFNPYVIRACVIGLLRAEAITVRDGAGTELTSIKDPGIKEALTSDTGFKRCEIIQSQNQEISRRDMVKMARFFEDKLKTPELKREKDDLADAVFGSFERLDKRMNQVSQQLMQLDFKVPLILHDSLDAMSQCRRDRRVVPTLLSLAQNLPILEQGVDQLEAIEASLSDENLAQLKVLHEQLLGKMLPQLRDAGALETLKDEVKTLEAHMESAAPWQLSEAVEAAMQSLETHYYAQRESLLAQHQQGYQDLVAEFERDSRFAKLSKEETENVQRELRKALPDSAEKALSPALVVLKQNMLQKLEAVRHDVTGLIDEYITLTNPDPKPDLYVEAQLSKYRCEVESEDELRRLADQFYDDWLPYIDEGKRVRFQ